MRLSVENLSYSYGGQGDAITDVCLSVDRG